MTCHDADPIIHTPWIDGAKDERGDPILPKMGIRDGFAEGFNEAPYSLVNLEGQGWTMPKHITSEERSSLHQVPPYRQLVDGRRNWMRRLEGHGHALEWPPQRARLEVRAPLLDAARDGGASTRRRGPRATSGRRTDFIQNCYTINPGAVFPGDPSNDGAPEEPRRQQGVPSGRSSPPSRSPTKARRSRQTSQGEGVGARSA